MKALKIIIGIVVVLLVFAIFGFWLASRYLTEDRIKALIIPPLEESTGLRVSIGKIKRQGFAGIQIGPVSFLDPQEKTKVLSSEKLELSLKLLPLLKGELTVTELSFIRPHIVIVREKDGRLNLERYFVKEEKAPKREAAPPKLALVFQNIRLKGAEIIFRDERGEYPPAKIELDLNSRFSLSGRQIVLDGQGDLEAFLAQAPLISDLKFQLRVQGEQATFSILQGRVFGGKLLGEIRRQGENLSGKIRLEGGAFSEAGKLAQRLKPYFFPEAEIPKLNGTFDLLVQIRGPLAKPEIEASFLPKPLLVTYPPYQIEISGKAAWAAMILRPDLSLKINGENLKLSGKIDLRERLPQADLSITGKKFDLKNLIIEEPSENLAKNEEKRGSAKASSLVIPLKGKIRISLEELCYRLCAQNFRTEILLDPDRILLNDLELLLAGAATQLQGEVRNLRQKPLSSFSFSVAGLDLPLVLKGFLPESSYLTSGRVWSEGKFDFRGLSEEEIKRSLTGMSKAKFLDLGLKESPILRALASLLRMKELERLHFKQGEGSLTIKNGLVSVKGKFTREGLVVFLGGTVGLDGRLNLSPKILFQGKMADLFAHRFPGASLFKTDKGYLIPLTIRGTVEEPKLALVQIQEKIKEKAVEKLFRLLGPQK